MSSLPPVSASRRQAVVLASRFHGKSDVRDRGMFKRRATKMRARLIIVLISSYTIMNTRIPRQVWCYTRSCKWWEHVVCHSFSQADWRENFRLSHETFNYICDKLKPTIMKQDTRFRRAISVEKRVAITLWVLATTSEYRSVAHLFGVARCTVCVIVRETCQAIVMVLLPIYICFPTGDRLNETVQGFLDRWGIPQCAGSIDGSHIPIRPPALNHTDYYNRKEILLCCFAGSSKL